MTFPPKRPTIGAPTGRPGGGQTSPLQYALRLMQQGNFDEAEQSVRVFLKSAVNHPDALHLLGLIAFQRGDAAGAANWIGRAIKAGSTAPEHHKNYGYALKAAGKLQAAAAAYEKATELAPLDAAAWNDRGTVLSALVRNQDAETAYRRAIELAPKDPKAYVNLASLLERTNRAKDAVKIAKQAVALAPKLAAAQNALGNAQRGIGDLDAAFKSFEAARAADPQAIDPVVNLAAVMEETSKIDDALALCRSVLDRAPGQPAATMILARCLRRQGDAETALMALAALKTDTLPLELQRDIAYEQSLLNDRTGNHAVAFDAMTLSNQLSMRVLGVDETRGDPFLTRLDDIKAWIASGGTSAIMKAPSIDDGFPDPIFVIGFPRSGTTLLGQVLDAHSRLVMAEEQTFLDQVIAEIADYPGGIDDLADADVKRLREMYFSLFREAFPWKEGQRVVDKFPLHLIHTGLIKRLFPSASLLFALRHPADVVLSCFMQTFSPNPAMANFFSIDRAAMTYDRVMSLWQAYEEAMAPDAHVVRYENVVADFDAEIGAMFEALDLGWEEGVRAFSEHARARGKINTPSYSQVTEKLYTRARYRWRRYEDQLASAMPHLAPWIERFGYDDEDAA